MSSNNIKSQLKQWVSQVGVRSAISYLINAGLAPSTAYALATDNYKSEPQELTVRAIRHAINHNEAS